MENNKDDTITINDPNLKIGSSPDNTFRIYTPNVPETTVLIGISTSNPRFNVHVCCKNKDVAWLDSKGVFHVAEDATNEDIVMALEQTMRAIAII